MFKKMNFKTLLFIFGGLLIIVVLIQLMQHKGGERNFRDKLFEVDTTKISAIILKSRNEKAGFRLARNGKAWNLVVNNKTYKADPRIMEGMLYELTGMKPERLAATDKSGWAELGVTDTASTRVQVEQEGKVVADFLVGKPVFQSQYKQSTYVRLYGEDEAYAVNGFLAWQFSKPANDFRIKSLANVNPGSITKLTFSYPADSSFTLVKENTKWKMNNERADSAKVASFLYTFANLSGNSFVDDVVTGNQVFQLKIEGSNFPPVELKAFAADTINKYIVTSNMNSGANFSAAKDNLISRVFVGAEHFKSTPKKEEKSFKKKK
jgi:hypothetical protein